MPPVITKAVAEIKPGDDDADTPTGSFHVILSAQTRDRDGDVLRKDEWAPLPEWINFDQDHGMSVKETIGSGRPYIGDDGDLHVEGTYTSLPRGQEVRTLVNEGHIRQTSVAFMTTKRKGAGGTEVTRELLNGAFVAVPSNPDARVLASKSAHLKVGARNSADDAATIQDIHDAAVRLGATCEDDDPEADEPNGKSAGYQPQPYSRDADETVECPACGKYNAPDARYCDQCGHKLVGDPDVEASKSVQEDPPDSLTRAAGKSAPASGAAPDTESAAEDAAAAMTAAASDAAAEVAIRARAARIRALSLST